MRFKVSSSRRAFQLRAIFCLLITIPGLAQTRGTFVGQFTADVTSEHAVAQACASAEAAVRGQIDSVSAGNDGTYSIHGWPCGTNDPNPIQVAVYLGAPAGDTTAANSPGSGAKRTSPTPQSPDASHQFSIPMDGFLQKFGGAQIYVYGISNEDDKSRVLLANSGHVTIPAQRTPSLRAARAASAPVERTSESGPIRIVDCSVWGNCSANNPGCVQARNCGQAKFKDDPNTGGNSLGYAYGASIIWVDGKYHVFFCSRGGDTQNRKGKAWDAIRYVSSSDGRQWSSPVVKLTAQSSNPTSAYPAGTTDLAACDPSVVFYGGYFYLFYGSAHVVVTSEGNVTSTVVQVARSAKIDGTYETFTDRGTWQIAPPDPHVIISPQEDLAGHYGAGQPSVIVYKGHLRMWYTDTSRKKNADGSGNLLMLDSDDPVKWSTKRAIPTNSPFVNVDVKFDSGNGKFILYAVNTDVPAHSTSMSHLVSSTSTDGITWNAATALNVASPTVPFHVDSIAASGDQEGALVPNQPQLISFGSSTDLAPGAYLLKYPWNLWGVFTTGSRLP